MLQKTSRRKRGLLREREGERKGEQSLVMSCRQLYLCLQLEFCTREKREIPSVYPSLSASHQCQTCILCYGGGCVLSHDQAGWLMATRVSHARTWQPV